MRKQKILVGLLCVFSSIVLNAQVEIYVSPTGDDINVGSEKEPLASLTGARNLIRTYKKGTDSSISFTVIVKDGFYEMTEPLQLSTIDSGSSENPIVYKAEKGAKPIFSGGKKITGFKVNEDGLWETSIFESSYYKWRFNQLYVNNKRATLARTPNKGFVTIDSVSQNIWEQGFGKQPKKAQQTLRFDTKNFQILKDVSNDALSLIRFKAFHKWDLTIRNIDKIDNDSLLIVTSGKGMKPWNKLKKEGRVVFENYKAALDEPGEWFLNLKGTLFYKPLVNQTIENTEFIAPVLESLIEVSGDIENENYVTNITFEGLSFKHSAYNLPATGFEPNQAAALINATIKLEGVKNISFKNCEVSDIGQHAIWFGKGSSNSIVEHCYIHNIGGGGIYLGDFKALNGKYHTEHIKVNNNIIQTGGQEFAPAVGIWVGHSSDNEITYNDIGNFYYTGISVGWVWGYKPSLAKNNKIAFNRVHHIGWDLLSDMSGIYTLGQSEGTILENNVVHDIHAYSYGGWGLYADEGSSGITMENNLVYKTKTGGFQQHYGENNVVRNNIFAFAKLYQAQCVLSEDHHSFDFISNIIIFDKGYVLKGAWDKVDISMDKNIYWNVREKAYNFNDKSFEEWQQLGHDQHSLIINPEFKDAVDFDFRFKSKKNIKKIDFMSFDVSEAGVYGNKKWTSKAVLAPEIIKAFDKAVEKNMLGNYHLKR
ncbi:right-handed parallel beta-helix repeat-containing protein [Cellulophaga baltica]|uniref:right-handed parallel beta-helix repeat-containing protein n=1 Tax=Cellulophaga TaxID=104264 RepID=UPI001C0655A3|nr:MULTISPECIES: right-handed parallel beta-helix repeat-containing protein [Cellulophaga]MBU2995062.1 right-handed parallel beta-helix repeat-containing protein [Cellulophaga baltica]MDO6766457.1 right-handed parallel beta-helix repeat-containing protein [Cellulophaga sp. 1_MG-2023]